jgi:cell division protein FtsB
MTYVGLLEEIEAVFELKKLKRKYKKLQQDKTRGENDLEKKIDILTTDNDIKDYEIKTLKDEIKKLKEKINNG